MVYIWHDIIYFYMISHFLRKLIQFNSIFSCKLGTILYCYKTKLQCLAIFNHDTHRADISAFLGQAKTPTEPIHWCATQTRIIYKYWHQNAVQCKRMQLEVSVYLFSTRCHLCLNWKYFFWTKENRNSHVSPHVLVPNSPVTFAFFSQMRT
jgi:hypothetical protein